MTSVPVNALPLMHSHGRVLISMFGGKNKQYVCLWK